MTVELLLFGPVAEAFGSQCLELTGGQSITCRDLQEQLHRLRPDLVGLIDSCRWAQNQRFVTLESRVTPGDEIALIPPVAGG